MRTKLLLALGIGLSSAFASLISPSSAHAYVPTSQTIAGRMARTHGKGAYVVDQDVLFRTNAEPLVLHERWVVANGEDMRLTVSAGKTSADGMRYDAVYKEGKRTSPDLAGNLRVLATGPEFIEGYQHGRNGRTILAALVRAQVLPASFLKAPARPAKIEQYHYTPEPLVRLGRTLGNVSYVFGEPSPVEGRLKPQVWIEQDAFRFLRIRFPSEAEVAMEKSSNYAGGLQFPRERTVTWGNNSVTIRVSSVKPLTPAQATAQLSASQITPQLVKAARLPELAQVREFYSRFR